jgi:hypothetical protein
MDNKNDIEGIIGNINELEKSLIETIQYTDSPTVKANAETELKKLQDIKARYVVNTNSLYEKAYHYDEASRALIGYQTNTQGAIQYVNQNLSNEERIAIREIENKRRMTQINNYYSAKYSDYIFITKMAILLCAIVIVLSVLAKQSIISRGIYSLLVIITGSIILSVIIIRWLSMRNRDPVNYNQFKFYVPSYTPTTSPVVYTYDNSTGMADASTVAPSNDESSGDSSSEDDGSNGKLGRISGIILDI